MKDRILKIRNDNQLTQDAFAKKLNISKNFVWMLEKGERAASERTVMDICREFNVNKEWLLTGKGEMYDMPEDETAAIVSDLLEEDNPFYDLIVEIIKNYQKLDPKSQNVLNNLVKELLNNTKKEN